MHAYVSSGQEYYFDFIYRFLFLSLLKVFRLKVKDPLIILTKAEFVRLNLLWER